MTPPLPGAGDAVRSARSEWERRQDEQALAYRFLARCFHEPPSADWMAALARDGMFREWPFPSVEDDAAAGLALLSVFCESWDPAMLGRLTWDFNRLFVGPGEMRAAPWESVYRSKTKLTFQEPTLAVRALYERFGFESPALHREPDDHLALELDFLGALSDLAAEAVRDGDGERLAACFEAQTVASGSSTCWRGRPAASPSSSKHAETDYYRGAAQSGPRVARGIGAALRRVGARGARRARPGWGTCRLRRARRRARAPIEQRRGLLRQCRDAASARGSRRRLDRRSA